MLARRVVFYVRLCPRKPVLVLLSAAAALSLAELLSHCNYTVSQKNDADVSRYKFNVHQPNLVIFGRDVAERICYQMVICYPTSPKPN